MNKHSTKAIIFDGDGTLWRPAGADKNSRPDSIYKGDRVEKHSHNNLSLVDGAYDFLKNLRACGYKIFIVSAHPVPGPEALEELKDKILILILRGLLMDFSVRTVAIEMAKRM